MTLERLRPIADAVLAPAVSASLTLGLGPHALSTLGFAMAALAAVAFVEGGTSPVWYAAGALLVGISGVFDLLDGAVARERGIDSDAGDILDHTLDRYADIVLVGGIALGLEQMLLGFVAVTGVLMTSYLGTQAQAVGYGRLYAGLLGRSDRLVLIATAGVAMAVSPTAIEGLSIFGWLLVVLAVVGHLTAVQRFVVLWRDLD